MLIICRPYSIIRRRETYSPGNYFSSRLILKQQRRPTSRILIAREYLDTLRSGFILGSLARSLYFRSAERAVVTGAIPQKLRFPRLFTAYVSAYVIIIGYPVIRFPNSSLERYSLYIVNEVLFSGKTAEMCITYMGITYTWFRVVRTNRTKLFVVDSLLSAAIRRFLGQPNLRLLRSNSKPSITTM